VFAPLDRVVRAADRVAEAWRESQRLHERVTQLEMENLRLRAAAVENQQLRAQLELPPWHGHTHRAVEILAISGEPFPVAALLSAGRRQGVQRGDALVTREGLVGRVSEVYPTLSRAMMLTDPNSAVACEVESTGVLGVLHFVSAPRPRLLLKGVPLSDTVRVGQQLLTSSLSRRYPRAIRVGTVVRTEPDPNGLTQIIEVESAAKWSRLRHGFVIPRPPALEGMP
jgi:rod shape-determining protein MreC